MSSEGFAAEQLVKTGENKYHVQHGTDRNLIVEFYTDAEYQEFESTRAGHPVYKDVEMIRIRTPGINGNTIERKVKMHGDGSSPSDPQRFSAQWQAFRSQKEQLPEGFPLEQWPVLRKSQVMNLKAQGIHVLEQIIALPDSNLGVLGMEGRTLRDKAKAYLEKDVGQAMLAQAMAERDQLRTDLAALKEAVTALQGGDTTRLAEELAAARQEIQRLNQAAATPANPPKKRGRPSKKDTQ